MYVCINVFAGNTHVNIMDSLRSLPLSGHTKLQVAMMAKTNKDKVTIVRPPCQQQTNATDCGLFAIANATEFCHSPTIQNIDFDHSKLRSHWLKCIENGTFAPFSRLSERKKKGTEVVDDDIMSVYCHCRLPHSFDNMVDCDCCKKWFHHRCVSCKDDEAEEWFCTSQCESRYKQIHSSNGLAK